MRLDTASPLMSVASFPSCIIPPVTPELNAPPLIWVWREHTPMTFVMVTLEEISLPYSRLSHYTFQCKRIMQSKGSLRCEEHAGRSCQVVASRLPCVSIETAA